MAVAAATVETYDLGLIKEELQDAYSMITPEECPFQQLASEGSVDSTHYEWPTLDLLAPDDGNRVIEGDDDPDDDDATLPNRLGNYTQISDKVARISHTTQAVDAAAQNVQRMATQISLKMREMKRDKEIMLLSNVVANAGASGTARVTAGFPAFLRTNTIAGVGGTDPTLSGGTEGFPNAAAGAGTATALTEGQLNDLITDCWTAGASPSIILTNGGNKRRISSTFTGNSTRYKDAVDRKLIASIDFYDSDFGELTVVPTRFMPTNNPDAADDSYNVFVIDPEYIEIVYLETVRQKPLAETGHSIRHLVWAEYGLKIENEAAHGVIRDTDNTTGA